MEIEIPEPVIKAELDYSASRWTKDDHSQFVIGVEVGGVEVLRRTFINDYTHYDDPDFAWDAEEAKCKALAEFGRSLKALIGDDA